LAQGQLNFPALASAQDTAGPSPAPAQAQSNSAIPATSSVSASPVPSSPPETTSPDDSEDQLYGSPPIQPGVQGLERLNGLAPGSFGENPGGVPYSGFLTPTGVNFNSTNILNPYYPTAGNYRSLAPGEAQATASLGSGYSIPFLVRAPEPEDANIKVGPVYVKFHSLEGLVLYDDNYQHYQFNRRDELLVLLRLNMTVIAQITDNLQFNVSGSLDYLPLNQQFGVQTRVNLGLLGPVLAAQAAYETIIAGWPVTFTDQFRSSAAFFAESVYDNYDLFEGDQLYRQENGRFAFRSYNANQSFDIPSTPLIYFSNTIDAETSHLVPGDARLTLNLSHTDLWYNQNDRGLPNSRDDFVASLVSERENQRFKPFATYQATYIEGLPGVTQSIFGGIFGPIDDHLFLRAGAGYWFNTESDHNGELFYLSLDHTAGPYTSEHFLVDRGLSDFDQDEVTFLYYRLDQVLGPSLNAHLFVAHSIYDDIIDNGPADYHDELAGLQLNWFISSKTNLSLAGIVMRQEGFNGERIDTFTGRITLDHSLSDTLLLQLLYQYQHAVSNRSGDSYFENIVYLRLVKLLD
jgi:hypothetical protein